MFWLMAPLTIILKTGNFRTSSKVKSTHRFKLDINVCCKCLTTISRLSDDYVASTPKSSRQQQQQLRSRSGLGSRSRCKSRLRAEQAARSRHTSGAEGGSGRAGFRRRRLFADVMLMDMAAADDDVTMSSTSGSPPLTSSPVSCGYYLAYVMGDNWRNYHNHEVLHAYSPCFKLATN